MRRTRVVAGGERDVQRLVERVLAGLAGLQADQVDDLVLAVEHQVVQPEQGLRRGRSSGVRAQASWARRARRNASSTSSSRDCGMCASGWSPIGDRTSTVRPEVATRRSVRLADVAAVERVRRGRVVLGIVRSLDEWPGGRVPVAHVPRVCR